MLDVKCSTVGVPVVEDLAEDIARVEWVDCHDIDAICSIDVMSVGAGATCEVPAGELELVVVVVTIVVVAATVVVAVEVVVAVDADKSVDESVEVIVEADVEECKTLDVVTVPEVVGVVD